MAARKAEQVIENVRLLMEHVEGAGNGIAMQVLWTDLRDLYGVWWGMPEEDETLNPAAEMVAILKALPMPGMAVETVMAALAISFGPEAVQAERKRLGAWVAEQLKGWQ